MTEKTEDPARANEAAAPDSHVQPAETGQAQVAEADEQQDKLPANKVAVEDVGTLKKKLTVTVSRERIEAKLDEMYGELRQTAQVPGFRIGRAPRRLIEKRFGKEVVDDVRNALVGEALGQAVEETKLKTLGQPDLDLDAIELPDSGDMEFGFVVEVAPEFDLPSLEGIKVDKPEIGITQERLDRTIEQWRQSMASYEATQEAAAEGDMLVAGATIGVEGLDPVERHGLDIRVAPGQVEGLPLVELGKELSGKKAGESVSLTLDVPEAHPNEDWRDKKATVSIEVSEVRRRSLPEIDEAFAERLGCDSMDQVRERIHQQLESRLEVETRQAMQNQVRDYLLENTDLDPPEGIAARYADQMLQRRYVDLLYRGVPREEIDERLTELQATVKEASVRELKLTFILTKVAEQQNIEVTDAEINSRVAQMAAQQRRRPERLRQELAADGTLEAIKSQMAEEKAIDILLGNAEITEVDLEADADKKATAKKAKKSTKKSARKSAKKSTVAKQKTDKDK